MYEMGISLLLSLVMMCSSGGNVAQAEITPWEPSALYTDEEILDAIQEELQQKGFLAKLQDYEPVDFWGSQE